MKNKWLYSVIFLGLAILFVCFVPVGAEENLYDSVIRIHVLAASDSEDDQALKLRVRDRILAYASENLASFSDKADAEAKLGASLSEIQKIAEDELTQNGSADTVSVELIHENYPTRHYENELSLPQGNYLSLQVKIGEGAGKNWWCVLFPPICQNSATEAEDALLQAGMDEENVKTLTLDSPKYRVRFRLLEWWAQAREKIRSVF